jgi:outer membrane receptor for ferrienterochelin and colicins
MSLNKNNLTVFFLILFVNLTYSQETQEVKTDSISTQELDAVLITATRTIRQLSAVPLPVQLISKKEIKAVNSIRLSDILEEQTGLITVSDFGGGEGIQLQGLDSQYTLILIDGVPLIGRSAGTLDLNRISVGNIKQIEVVKGASSSLYGNEALGGVINIITETPKSGLSGDIGIRAGTFETFDTSLNINYKDDQFGINTFFNRNSSEGYNLNEGSITNTVDPYTNHTFSSNATLEVNEKTKIILSGRFYNQIQEEVVLSETLSGETAINEWNINFRTEYAFNDKWTTYLELYGSEYRAEEFFDSDVSEENIQTDFNQRFLRPELRMTYNPVKDTEFILGIGLTNERLNRTLFRQTPEFNAPYIYAQYDSEIAEKFNLIAGARFDSHNEYESQLSPKLALQYQINDKIAVKGSAGYGFKAPDFRQLFLDFTNSSVGYTVIGYNEVPNRLQDLFELDLLRFTSPTDGREEFSQEEKQNEINRINSNYDGNLKAESSISFNLGADIAISKNLTLNINGFRNNISNLIDVQIVQSDGVGAVTSRPQLLGRNNGQNVFSYINRDEVYTQGLELDTRWQVSEQISVAAGYQLLYAFDRQAQEEFKEGRVFARDPETLLTFQLDKRDYFGLFNRSRHTANFKVFYTIPEWDFDTNFRATYRSKFGIGDTNNNSYLDVYDDFVNGQTILDIAINKTFFDNYRLGIGIDNFLDLTDQQTPNLPGRLLYASLNINF